MFVYLWITEGIFQAETQTNSFIFLFYQRLTVMRIKRDAKCYLSPLPDSLPSPSLLKAGLQMVLIYKNSQSPFFWIFLFFSCNKKPLFTQKTPAAKRLVTFMLNRKQKAITVMWKPERERVCSTFQFLIVPLYKCCAQNGKNSNMSSPK